MTAFPLLKHHSLILLRTEQADTYGVDPLECFEKAAD